MIWFILYILTAFLYSFYSLVKTERSRSYSNANIFFYVFFILINMIAMPVLLIFDIFYEIKNNLNRRK